SSFSKGLTTSQSSLASLDSRAKLASAANVIGIDDSKNRLTIDNCTKPYAPKPNPNPKKQRCTLSADGVTSIRWEKTASRNALKAMQGLVDYAQGLVILVGASDVTKFNAGLKTIDGAFSGTVKVEGTSVSAGTAQYESLGIFILSQIVEAQRVATVRDIIIS